MTRPSHIIRTFESIEGLKKEQWAKLCSKDFPFADQVYLQSLELSGSVGRAAGWSPRHITAWNQDELVGAVPLYLKDNSYGEYIFDWGWADAYQKHGLAYYPKLVSAIPFTPATGPKLLMAGSAEPATVASTLIRAVKEQVEATGSSSAHFLFLTSEELPYFEREGFLIRHSFQYHWTNRKFTSFEAFLDSLKPRKRKQIMKERAELAAQNLKITRLRGADLKAGHAKIFHSFYVSTIEKMGAIAYLNLPFFESVFRTMSDQILLILAEDSQGPVAAALTFEKGDSLYGRYWGASKEIRNLHFELCYYQPLEYAIARGLERFEAGAQGEHKVARGFLPELTFSAHWIRHPSFSPAIAHFIDEEKKAIAHYFTEVKQHSPYREV